MKKILFFIPFGLETAGGAERVLTLICNNLVDKEYKIEILSYEKTKVFYELSPEISLLNLSFKNSKNFFIRKLKPLLLVFKLRRVILQNKYTHVVALGDEATILLSLTSLPKVINKITWIHNSIFENTYKILDFFRRISYKKMDKIIMLNKTDSSIYRKKYKEKVVLIPNPIINLEKNIFEKKLNKTILSVGRLSKIKNYEKAIEVFSSIEKKYPDWKYKIIGKDEGEKEKLLKLIKNLNLKNVEIKRETSNINEEYKKADIFLMTSINECFPMVLLEARSNFLPIISFDCDSGPRDIVINGYNGFLIKNKNIEKMKEKLIFLIENEKELFKFKKQSGEGLKKYYIKNILKYWKEEIFI